MPLLRRNLTCFYCGTKSELKKDPHIRQFECKECEAVNYLDENGQITDPPVSATAEPVRYAHYISARSPSPNLSAPEQNLFCSTCLKNQHLLTQTLAAYLPPPTDPSYNAYERSYPEYRYNLEKRYPPVCTNCAPRVRERIKAAGYAAKTDHLRRLMERTKNGGLRSRRYHTGPTWQGIVVWCAGVFWWISIIVHMLWSVLGTFAVPGMLGEGRDTYTPHGGTCGYQAWKYGMVQADCVSTWYPEMKFLMWAALATFWWNNKLRQKIGGSGGRLVGLKDHLALQVLMLAVRGGSWWALRDPTRTALPIQAYRGAHLLTAFLLFGTAIASSCLVKIDHTPRFSFKEKQEQLLPSLEEESPEKLKAFYNSDTNQAFNSQSPAYVKPFPINNLAQPMQMHEPPSPSPSYSTRYSAFTTEATTRPYDEDEDTMEWTPTKPTASTFFDLRPRQTHAQAQAQAERLHALLVSTADAKSPFYGTLPPAPVAPAHKLRNPLNQPTFKKAPLAKQKDFFSKLMSRPGTATDAGSTATDQPDDRRQRTEFELSGPKLRLQENPVDTGLEAMFDTVFSIRDEPAEVRAEDRPDPSDEKDDILGGDVDVNAAFVFALPFALIGIVFAWQYAWATITGQQPV